MKVLYIADIFSPLKTKMQLKFDPKSIKALATRYEQNNQSEDAPLERIRSTIQRQKHLTLEQLIILAEWKSPRIRHHIEKNENSFVIEVTKAAFNTDNLTFQIEVLTLLKGVGWPMASVILHFYFLDPYPIIDFRALFSINCAHVKPEKYNYQFWEEYVRFFRSILDQTGVDKRTLDKALWQYSYEYQNG